MKRLLLGFMIGVCLIGAVSATVLNQLGQTMLSDTFKIYRQTMPAANTIYPVTLEAGSTVSLDIQAVTADIRWCLTNSTTEAYWSIPQNSVFTPTQPLQFAKNTVLYFWSTSASTPEVQVLLNYR